MKNFQIYTIFSGSLLVILTLLLASQITNAEPNSVHSIINLKSCNLQISADQIDYHNNTISFSGNVQFLYGLANVRTHNLIMVKNKDGSCDLMAQFWYDKITT